MDVVRFTDGAAGALSIASTLASSHAEITPFHVALALFRQRQSMAYRILKELKLNAGKLAKIIARTSTGKPKPSDELLKMLDTCRTTASKWHDWCINFGFVGTETLLYVLLANNDVAQALNTNQSEVLALIKKWLSVKVNPAVTIQHAK